MSVICPNVGPDANVIACAGLSPPSRAPDLAPVTGTAVGQATMPRRMAMAIACARSVTPSLR